MADKAKKSQMFAVLASGWWLFPNRMAVWGKIIQTKHTKSFLWRQRWPTWLQDGNLQTGKRPESARGRSTRIEMHNNAFSRSSKRCCWFFTDGFLHKADVTCERFIPACLHWRKCIFSLTCRYDSYKLMPKKRSILGFTWLQAFVRAFFS